MVYEYKISTDSVNNSLIDIKKIKSDIIVLLQKNGFAFDQKAIEDYLYQILEEISKEASVIGRRNMQEVTGAIDLASSKLKERFNLIQIEAKNFPIQAKKHKNITFEPGMRFGEKMVKFLAAAAIIAFVASSHYSRNEIVENGKHTHKLVKFLETSSAPLLDENKDRQFIKEKNKINYLSQTATMGNEFELSKKDKNILEKIFPNKDYRILIDQNNKYFISGDMVVPFDSDGDDIVMDKIKNIFNLSEENLKYLLHEPLNEKNIKKYLNLSRAGFDYNYNIDLENGSTSISFPVIIPIVKKTGKHISETISFSTPFATGEEATKILYDRVLPVGVDIEMVNKLSALKKKEINDESDNYTFNAKYARL